MRRFIGKLHFVYEAGPCGYDLYRQINAAGNRGRIDAVAHAADQTDCYALVKTKEPADGWPAANIFPAGHSI